MNTTIPNTITLIILIALSLTKAYQHIKLGKQLINTNPTKSTQHSKNSTKWSIAAALISCSYMVMTHWTQQWIWPLIAITLYLTTYYTTPKPR